MNLFSPPEGPFSLAAMSFIALSVSCLPVPAAITELVVLGLCSTVTPREYALGTSALSIFATLVALGSVVSHTSSRSARRDRAPVCLGHRILTALATVCSFVAESLLMLFCEGVVLGVDMFIFVVHERLVPFLWRGLKFIVLCGIPTLLMHAWGLFIVLSATFELLWRRTCAFGDVALPYAYSKLSSICKATTSWASRAASSISTKYDDAALRISATFSVLLDAYTLLLEQDGKFKLANLPFRDASTATTALRISSTFATPRATKTNTDIKTDLSIQTIEDITESIPIMAEPVQSAEDETSSIEESLPSVVDGIPSAETPIPDPMPTIIYIAPTTPPPAPETTLFMYVALIYVPEPIVFEDADVTSTVVSVEDGETTLLIYVTAVTPKPEPQWEYANCEEVDADIVDEPGALALIVSPTPSYPTSHNTDIATVTTTIATTTIATVDTEFDIVRVANIPIPADLCDDLEDAILPFQHEATLPFEDEPIFPFDGEDALPFDDSTTPVSVTTIFPFANEDILPYYDEATFPFADEEILPFQESTSSLSLSIRTPSTYVVFPFQNEDDLPFDVEAIFPFEGEASLPSEESISCAHLIEAALPFEGEDILPLDFEAALPFEDEDILPFEEATPSLENAYLPEHHVDTESLDHDLQIPSEALVIAPTSTYGTTVEAFSTHDAEDDSEAIEIDEMEAAPVLLTYVAPALPYEPPRIPISISFDSYLGQRVLKTSSATHSSASFKSFFTDRTSDTPPTEDEDVEVIVHDTETTTEEPECARPPTPSPAERAFVPRAQAPSFTPRAPVPPPATRLSPEARPFQPPQVKPPTALTAPIPPTRATLKNPPPFWAPRPAFIPYAQAPTFVPRATVPVFAPQAPVQAQRPVVFQPTVLPPPFQPRVQAPAFVPQAPLPPPPPAFAPRLDAPSFVPRAQVPTFVPRLQAPTFVPSAVVDKAASASSPTEPPAPTGEADEDAIEDESKDAGDEDNTVKKRKKTRRGGKRAKKQRERKQAKMKARAEAQAKAQAEAGDTEAVQDTADASEVQATSKWSWAEEVEAAEDESEDGGEDEDEDLDLDLDSEVEIILEAGKLEFVEMSGLLA
ncbi:hypothetical protein C8Q78DRAFT_792000 [Trametes maxima]|nr:hypothetical protein C8Q78DRAFT_792000 [Trametes maxima]